MLNFNSLPHLYFLFFTKIIPLELVRQNTKFWCPTLTGVSYASTSGVRLSAILERFTLLD
jgi:hypothetical protein